MLTATKTDSKSTRSNAVANQPKAKEQDKNGFDDDFAALEAVGIQTKLTIGKPNDRYEQEADRVADKVVKMSSSSHVLRKCAACEAERVGQQKPLAESITPWVQKQAEKKEEEPQPKFLQRQESEEEPIKAKLLQRQEDLSNDSLGKAEEKEKKEPIQGKFLQKQENLSAGAVAKEEEKEPAQAKFIHRQEDLSAEAEDEDKEEIAPKLIQTKRFSPITDKTSGASLESRLNGSKGSGTPLSDDTGSFMESRIGTDFSNVRIHTSNNAVQMSKELNAHAFTHGNDIYFNQGEYDPGSNSGKHLLAHELTHVVQQTHQSPTQNIQTSPCPTIEKGTQKRCGKWCKKPYPSLLKGIKNPSYKDITESSLLTTKYNPFISSDKWYIDRFLKKYVDVHGPEFRNLWEKYLTGGGSAGELKSKKFKNAFETHSATSATTCFLMTELQTRLDRKSSNFYKRISGNNKGDVSDLIKNEIEKINKEGDKNEMSFADPKTIPGLIAGGVGSSKKAKDSRLAQVKVRIAPLPNTPKKFKVTPYINYTVIDAIDFCPGNCGGFFAEYVTIAMARLEASKVAGSVSFSVNFTGKFKPFAVIEQ